MAVSYTTQGFVFKKEDRADSDRLFSVFTKDFGRLQVMGKAIRKITSKLRGGMDIFHISEIEFIQGKHKKTLIDATPVKNFKGIFESPEKLLLAHRISEVIDIFIKGQQRDESIFLFCEEIFTILHCDQSKKQLLIFTFFFWNFISHLGYGPELANCAACSQKLQPERLYFSYQEGGVVCPACAMIKKNQTPIHPDTVKVLRLMLKKNWGTIVRIKMTTGLQDQLKSISENYYRYLLSSHT